MAEDPPQRRHKRPFRGPRRPTRGNRGKVSVLRDWQTRTAVAPWHDYPVMGSSGQMATLKAMADAWGPGSGLEITNDRTRHEAWVPPSPVERGCGSS
jgi:hypothetical protein